MDCIFCKIIDKTIPSKILYEDDLIVAFFDMNMQAPVHFLVVPKVHIKSCDYIIEDNKDIIAHIFMKIKDIADLSGIINGYRVVNNCGENGGQTVDHIHFHVLGNRNLSWPPG